MLFFLRSSHLKGDRTVVVALHATGVPHGHGRGACRRRLVIAAVSAGLSQPGAEAAQARAECSAEVSRHGAVDGGRQAGIQREEEEGGAIQHHHPEGQGGAVVALSVKIVAI